MTSLARLARLAGVTAVLAVLVGCAPVRVNSYAERAVDFSRYRTYAWSPTAHGPTGDPRLDNNRFFHERVIADVDSGLAARGYEKAATGEPDLVVHYHASVTQEIDLSVVDAPYCDTNDCRPHVYEAGTLLFDLVDARTNRIVWRGWAEGSIEGIIDNQDLMEERIDQAVTRILAQLPRRP
jgi:hypothetical protein